ncbi:Pimeloyl-ACP methyl ester carboxylesterase [Pseudomonas sp. NFPP10]|uniref:alpha/beta fold hydrolase n=1 Tax=unclassified Pseudomonas TaxID=196821 RepID=UPI00088F95D2|nr:MULTISPECIES: alpha/beta fold hydrolase [unclassified Pseudomonas]SDA24979.1 Pimeloyl-ACP methyl ester carboxylesterase [Pseudomonas sp. NFPP12]SEL73720.1 Pimeloyl-ACP methyl ester carboxylesterase [Pseudomonas sp. NFPP10]SFJ49637.1 Pimeloyl-ACP methyl ester carboxylesterase [Pseudomonas sp. NFPP08]SFM89007.1 Pimeloyl-ACP methyl ester carboxylesterase [Pseudomonas sp. NFPP05]SFX63128.1 Pimeloyl-ACP methyl ester carboxylesterase [Pseudomonas sp. NFPP09]
MLVILVLLLLAALWCYRTYPRIGHLLYDASVALEARLYRLQKVPVQIGEETLMTYQGGPAQAPVILLLHGLSADKSIWLRFARHFNRDYRLLIPDLGGHGETAYAAHQDYRVPAQAQRLLRLLDACGIQRVQVIGNSMGGYIAAWLAAHAPQRISGLALFDPAGVEAPETSDLQHLLEQGKNPFLVRSRADFQHFYSLTMAAPPWVPEAMLAAIAERYQARRGQLARIFAELQASPPMEPELAKIQAPTLLLWGREDRLLHPSSAQVWAKGLPQAQVQLWEGIGHMPMVERPVRSARLYQQFLERQRH